MKILRKSDNLVCVLIPAHRRTVFLNRTPYFLSFPTLIFKFEYYHNPRGRKHIYYTHDLRMAAVKTEDVKRDTPAYFFALPNRVGTFDVCLGVKEITGKTLDELIVKVMTRFWTSGFTGNWAKKIFETWAAGTKEDPTWLPEWVFKYNPGPGDSIRASYFLGDLGETP